MNPNWGNEYGMPNNYGMPMNPMMPNMMPPLVPPMCMISEMGHPNPTPTPGPMIGPVMMDSTSNHSNDVQIMEDATEDNKDQSIKESMEPEKQQASRYNSNNRDNRRDRNFDRDRSRRRSRSRDRNTRNDRNRDQERNDRNGHRNERRRDRPSKWEKTDDNQVSNMNNMQMMPGMMPMMMNNNMMNNMGHQMGHPSMDMGNMQNVNAMQHNMMPGMNMMPNMMPNMMDPTLMMMNQLMPNQPIYFSTGILLPPLPGMSLPNRREKPLGCRTIFVGGLPNGITVEVVTEIFQRFGHISDVKLHRQGVCHVRFANHVSVEQSFNLSGYRFKLHEQTENEATTLFVDYALNRDDQNEYERNKRHPQPAPVRIEPFTPANLTSISEKIKNDDDFSEAAPTLHGWLERGECNKKYANTFYSLIQAANNHVRRFFNDKMQVDEEFQTAKNAVKEKYLKIVTQFEQVAKILTVAKHQRVSDHFTKQQRRNIEMWLKMTEELDNIKEEYNLYFEDEDTEKSGKNVVAMEKYEELQRENENLTFELEGYRNEAHLAKDEAERKFEKFKAQFIAQQALQNPKQKAREAFCPYYIGAAVISFNQSATWLLSESGAILLIASIGKVFASSGNINRLIMNDDDEVTFAMVNFWMSDQKALLAT
ncbi:hypothetical protein evm_003462 [Chilo suppressalis]|nr:hypothetical protein evm_003462 [Chilo suppressalis]